MKTITFFALIIMTFTFVSCGGKDSGGKGNGQNISQYQAGQPYTKDGYYDIRTQSLEIDGMTYPPSQAYMQVMTVAIQQAQAQQIQPIVVNGAQKFRARISGVGTGYVNQGYGTVGYQQGNQLQYGQQTLNLTSVQFYR